VWEVHVNQPDSYHCFTSSQPTSDSKHSWRTVLRKLLSLPCQSLVLSTSCTSCAPRLL
jgi:hypothetical protein